MSITIFPSACPSLSFHLISRLSHLSIVTLSSVQLFFDHLLVNKGPSLGSNFTLGMHAHFIIIIIIIIMTIAVIIIIMTIAIIIIIIMTIIFIPSASVSIHSPGPLCGARLGCFLWSQRSTDTSVSGNRRYRGELTYEQYSTVLLLL